jgi:hypothetical protein
MIPVGIEPYERTNDDGTTTLCYRAYQVWTAAWTEYALDVQFGDLKAQFPDDYYVAAMWPVRQKRNRLLTESDWTQLPDAPVDRAAWAAYRHALRNLPAQDGAPFNLEWPLLPQSEELPAE